MTVIRAYAPGFVPVASQRSGSKTPKENDMQNIKWRQRGAPQEPSMILGDDSVTPFGAAVGCLSFAANTTAETTVGAGIEDIA